MSVNSPLSLHNRSNTECSAMTKFTYARTLFQLISIAIFLYQMNSSLGKYFDKPIVQETSTISIDDMNQMPVMYICQDAQFGYAEGKSYGYPSLWKFLIGKLENTNNFTWTGKHRNQSFAKLQKILFNVNYNSTTVHSSETRNYDFPYVQSYNDSIFISPYGYCMKLKKQTIHIQVKSTVKTDVILTDPVLENQIRITGMQYGTFGIGPTPDGLFETKHYEIALSLHDLSVHDGKTCTDYEKTGSSYGECTESMFKDTILEWYGCLPTWVQDNSIKPCGANMSKLVSDEQIIYEVQNEMNKLVTGFELNMFKQCMKPCMTMQLNYNLRRHILKRLDKSDIRIMFDEKVTVFKDVFAYDGFNLVVDVGSALGLWLGLSALSIFDKILEFYNLSRSKCYH